MTATFGSSCSSCMSESLRWILMELKTKFNMISQKMFGSGHPNHLFTNHLLHIEIAMVFSLKEKKRRNHKEAGWCCVVLCGVVFCCVVLCFAVVMHMLENDENGVQWSWGLWCLIWKRNWSLSGDVVFGFRRKENRYGWYKSKKAVGFMHLKVENEEDESLMVMWSSMQRDY